MKSRQSNEIVGEAAAAGQQSPVVGVTEDAVCRICQQPGKLVHLGCDCRGDLGLSHDNCAFVWFRQKSDSTCEICGKTAKNIIAIQGPESLVLEISGREGINSGVEREINIVNRPTIIGVGDDSQRSKCLCILLIFVLFLGLFLSSLVDFKEK